MTNSIDKSFVKQLVFGSIFIFAGAFIFLTAIDVIHAPDENFNAPRWVIAAVGLAFALAGAMVIVKGLESGFGDDPIYKWISTGMILAFLVFFAAPFNWVAFGPGERSFSGSTSIGPIAVNQSGASDFGGRMAFGIGAILMDILIIYILFRLLRGRRISSGE
jgi:hypothetical protein